MGRPPGSESDSKETDSNVSDADSEDEAILVQEVTAQAGEPAKGGIVGQQSVTDFILLESARAKNVKPNGWCFVNALERQIPQVFAKSQKVAKHGQFTKKAFLNESVSYLRKLSNEQLVALEIGSKDELNRQAKELIKHKQLNLCLV